MQHLEESTGNVFSSNEIVDEIMEIINRKQEMYVGIKFHILEIGITNSEKLMIQLPFKFSLYIVETRL